MIKQLYILWFQGFENAPLVVKHCLTFWKHQNPDWSIIVLDDTNLRYYIDLDSYISKNVNISKTHLSDIVRILLLKKYGGLWVDSTSFCNVPLNNWLEQNINSGFFAFNSPGKDRMLSNWFLYAEKDNYIISKLYDEIRLFWKVNNSTNDYFWFHHLFERIYNKDNKFKEIWDQTNKISAIPSFRFEKGFKNNITPKDIEIINSKTEYVYKLTYKYQNELNINSAYNYLLKLDNFTIATKNYLVSNIYPELFLIHIGKCGGTYILDTFKNNNIKLNEVHVSKIIFNPNIKYIIWLRHPVSRFISTFNFTIDLINTDVSKLNKSNLDLNNTLAPGRIMLKMKNKHTFNQKFDLYINEFKTANNLAEALYSDNKVIRDKAEYIMKTKLSAHFLEDTSWYLDNGDFIEKHNNNIIFVGRLEYMNEDMNKLSKKIGYNLILNKNKVRENKNKHNNNMSQLALQNLYKYYKDSEIKTLESLYKYDFIDKKTFDDYSNFSV
jgi:hypothetical protein